VVAVSDGHRGNESARLHDPACERSSFRSRLYGCFGQRADALFKLCDALLTAGSVPSPVHLSLVPVHRRGWGSFYAALEKGRTDEDVLKELLASHDLSAEGTSVYAVDVSLWPRCDAEALVDDLRERSLLLVLDNFELQLEAAPEVATLVDACPGLVVLATSRAPLRIRGEREHPVPPLVLPTTTRSPVEEEILASPSGMLFAERAQASAPGFTITRENAAAVAAICWRLAGLPLALDLAAAKVRFLDPATLLSRLDEALSTAWARDLPVRQRTMRATLDWSHDLLSKEERALFRRFSVFAGGFTLEAAEEVCASEEVEPEEILELLGRLVEQSLVVVRTDTEGLRYGMLEPVRQYALERLGESGEAAAMRERHAQYFLALAETAKSELRGPEAVAWLDRIDHQHDNLREALGWAREVNDLETGLRLSGELCCFWWRRGYLGEGRRWVEGFISEDPDVGQPTFGLARAGALYGAGALAFGQGDLVRATELFEEGLTLYRELGDEVGVANVLVELGQVARAQGDYDRAATLSEESLALGRKLG